MKLFQGKFILIVDDEELLREILESEFKYFGATVFSVKNGALALELMKTRNFDAIISDVRMPGGDGLSLFKDIKANFTIKPKFFFHSGFNDIKKDSPELSEVSGIFSKPTDLEKMVQSIAEALGITKPPIK